MIFNLKIKMFEKFVFIVNEIFQKIRIAFQFYFLKRIQNFAEKNLKNNTIYIENWTNNPLTARYSPYHIDYIIFESEA